jgi:hypothetical protein
MSVSNDPPVMPRTYPNAEHIPDARISRRALYRAIERIAGMTVSQSIRDCMGDEVQRPEFKPAEIYAHVLKAIAEFEPHRHEAELDTPIRGRRCLRCGAGSEWLE